jgi:bacillithiol system protein YtxJ
MKWKALTSITQLEEIKEISQQQPILIFKHSTRCSISATALSRLERAWKDEEMMTLTPYFLDLIAYRPISNAIADMFDVVHQSPQVLVIHKGKCVYHTSHLDIAYTYLKSKIEQLKLAA